MLLVSGDRPRRQLRERDRHQRHRQEHLPGPCRLLRGRRRRRRPRPADDLRGQAAAALGADDEGRVHPGPGAAGRRLRLSLGAARPRTAGAAGHDPTRASRSGEAAGGEWSRVQTVHAGADAGQIALGDYDNSGTLDVMLAGKQRLRLLRNRRGRLHPVRGNLGLPSKAAAASFVDYDNDGRLDVDLAPQGLYRWKSKSPPLRRDRRAAPAPDRLRDRPVGRLRQRRPPRSADRHLQARVLPAQQDLPPSQHDPERALARGRPQGLRDQPGGDRRERADRRRPGRAAASPSGWARTTTPATRRATTASTSGSAGPARCESSSSAGRRAARPGCATSAAIGC